MPSIYDNIQIQIPHHNFPMTVTDLYSYLPAIDIQVLAQRLNKNAHFYANLESSVLAQKSVYINAKLENSLQNLESSYAKLINFYIENIQQTISTFCRIEMGDLFKIFQIAFNAPFIGQQVAIMNSISTELTSVFAQQSKENLLFLQEYIISTINNLKIDFNYLGTDDLLNSFSQEDKESIEEDLVGQSEKFMQSLSINKKEVSQPIKDSIRNAISKFKDKLDEATIGDYINFLMLVFYIINMFLKQWQSTF